MRFKKVGDKHLIKIFKGENVVESIIEFCKKNNIISGTFYGIGATNYIELLIYNSSKKNYTSKVFNEDMEIINITGNVAFLDDKHIIHAHITLSDKNTKAFGGHLKDAIISGTLELVFTDFKTTLNRKYDSETGLNLLDI